MKTKPSKQAKQSKPTARLKDLKPKKDAEGGGRSRNDTLEVEEVHFTFDKIA